MRESFDKAFEIVVGLEGGYSNDSNDPGGETKYGISKRYNPDIDIKNLTLEQAKQIYLERYWKPSGCDHALYPMDICLFDGAVNPQSGGNNELLRQSPRDWVEFLVMRMSRYMDKSKPIYVKGHLFRILKLYKKIKEDADGRRGT
jgi:hypothetical protein